MTTMTTELTSVEARNAAEAARHQVDQANAREAEQRSQLADLHDRIENGDHTVDGFALAAAEKEVEIASRQSASAAKRLVDADAAIAEAVARECAREVAALPIPSYEGFASDAVEAATQSISQAIADLATAIRDRERLSNDLGTRLHAAGVPKAETLEGVRYTEVRSVTSSRSVAGAYDVRVNGVPVSKPRAGLGDSAAHRVPRMLDSVIESALRDNGLKITPSGIARV